MQRPTGALAFEFGDGDRSGEVRLQPALGTRARLLRGPAKYRILEHRRRQAQIRARRLLDLLDAAELRVNAR
jgi:hypothetical protein